VKNTGPKQRGIAILAMLAIFTVVLTTAVIAGVSLNKQRLGKQNTTSNNLSKAKDALIGFALRQTPPGQLPCPDTNGDGFSNLSAGNCTRQLGFQLKNYETAVVPDCGMRQKRFTPIL